MLDPRRLLVLLAVARSGSLSAAARRLGVTQPAVAQQIRQLEREAGLALVVRRGRAVTLTDAARRLLPHLEAVDARLTAAAQELRSLAGGTTGAVRVASFPSGSATLVVHALDVLRTTHPGVTMMLVDAEPPEALNLLERGECDVALIFSYGEVEPLPYDTLAVELGEDQLFAALPMSHPFSRRRKVTLAELAPESFIGGCPRCEAHLRAAARRNGFEPNIGHSTDDYVVAQRLVAGGDGVALLPRLAITAYRHPEIITVPVAGADPRRVMALLHREVGTIPAVAAALAALTDAASVSLDKGARQQQAAFGRHGKPLRRTARSAGAEHDSGSWAHQIEA